MSERRVLAGLVRQLHVICHLSGRRKTVKPAPQAADHESWTGVETGRGGTLRIEATRESPLDAVITPSDDSREVPRPGVTTCGSGNATFSQETSCDGTPCEAPSSPGGPGSRAPTAPPGGSPGERWGWKPRSPSPPLLSHDASATLEWIARDLPTQRARDSCARNTIKHAMNLGDALRLIGDDKARTLDIGSGIGVLPTALANLGHKASSVDISRGPNAEWMEANGVEFEPCDLLTGRLPWRSGTFDLVTLLDVIEHFHGSPKHALAEILRVLRPGGFAIIETPNMANLRRRLQLVRGRNPRDVRAFYESPHPYRAHVYEYVMSGLCDVLRWSGFEIVEKRHVALVGRFHRTAQGYAPGVRIRSIGDLAMLGYLCVSRFVPSFRDTLLCIARRRLL